MPKRIGKSPGAILDYEFDFAALTNGSDSSDWLEAGETITETTVTAQAGLTADTPGLVKNNTAVKVWYSGGAAGERYDVTCHVATSAGREDDRTMEIVCFNR